MAEKANEKEQVACTCKSTAVKNILYLIFIVLVIVYCVCKCNEKKRYKAFNMAGGIYDNASVLSRAGDATAFAQFASARDIYMEICANAKKDPELKVDAEDMLARTYASMASCPQISGRMYDGYMLLALEASGPCPMVGDAMREKIGGMSAEERTALKEFVFEEEKRILQAPSEAESSLQEASQNAVPEK